MKRFVAGAAFSLLLVPAAFTQVPPPVIKPPLVPSQTTAGASAFTLEVEGSGFVRDDPIEGIQGSRVRWQREGTTSVVTLQLQSVTSTMLRATVPAALISTPGVADIQVLNVSFKDASNVVQFTINSPPRITTTSPLPDGFVGNLYFAPLEATGGTPGYLWSVTGGTLPPGLNLDAGGLINGNPTTAGTFQFELTLLDVAGVTARKQFSLTVIGDPVIVTSSPLPSGSVGEIYSLQFQANGGTAPYQWRVVEGSPPAGLSLSATGQLTGTPTQAGVFTFQVTVIDARQRSATGVFRLTIVQGLVITSNSPLPDAGVGSSYSFQFAATGGTPPYTWMLAEGSVLPAGLALSQEGLLSGTPGAAGSYAFTISVLDARQVSSTKQFSLTVAPPQVMIVTTSPLPEGTVDAPYSVNFQASGGVPPYTWSVIEGSPPPGISLSGSGALTGTPSTDGTFTLRVRVVDSTNTSSDDRVFSLVVTRAALRIVTGPYLPGGTVGTLYTASLVAAGGTAPYSWEVIVGGLPPGVDLATDGGLSGNPTAFGNFGFRARVTDSVGDTAEQDFAIVIPEPSLPQVSVQGLPPESEPAQQPSFQVTLQSPYGATIQGQATLTFTPDAVAPVDDPTAQFVSGGRTVNFIIAPGATEPTEQLAVQTGSVAGLIRVTVELSSSGVDITPSPQPVLETRIRRAPPVIRSVQVTRTTGGFEVTVDGISTPREVTQAIFRFTPNPQLNLQTTEVTVDFDENLNKAFSDWYKSETSTAFGSSFKYRQPFTISGDSNAVTGVTVTLRNSEGDSQPVSASF